MLRLFMALVFLTSGFFVSASFGESLPDGFFDHPLNGPIKPSVEDGEITFQVVEEGCSSRDYGDGRGESDCGNGNVKSQIGYRQHATPGEVRDYSFEFWVDPQFGYEGFFENDSQPFRVGGWDSNLRIASWEGPDIKSFVYMLKLDSRNGATFFGKQCAAPEDFGTWVKFSLKVRWANDASGWVKVTCDDRIVYSSEQTSSTAQIQCYITNECDPGVVRNPKRLQYIVGLALNGFGDDWAETGREGKFSALPPEGITIKMRNLSVSNKAELYSASEQDVVRKLQDALNGLGCDVGTPDGKVGKNTRLQALTCRTFEFAAMPAKLTVATLPTFLELYTRPGVADLPRGTAAADIPEVHVVEVRAEQVGAAQSAVSTFEGTVGGDRVSFLLIGEYNYGQKRWTELQLLLTEGMDALPDALAKCRHYRTEDWGDKKQLVLEFYQIGKNYKNQDRECIVNAVPSSVGTQARYLLEHFNDLAKGMVLAGDADRIQHDGVKEFINSVARDEVSVLSD